MDSPKFAKVPSIGKLTALRRDFHRKIRAEGFLGALNHAVARLIYIVRQRVGKSVTVPDPFDSQFGTDTATIVSVGALDIPNEKVLHANRYEAVSQEVFTEAMLTLPATNEYTFVDIGSGKGKALLLASHYPFREIVGIELSAQLTAIALENIAKYRNTSQKCSVIRVECRDALTCDLPLSNCILYLYNPFDGAIMQQFVSVVEESLADHPRSIRVVYQWPLHRIHWDRSPYLRLSAETKTWVVYESTSSSN